MIPSQDPDSGLVAMIDCLLGGTTAMRAAGKKYLPQWPLEEDDAYKARMAVSTLPPGYAETVGNTVDRLLWNPLTVSHCLPERVQQWLADFDGSGCDMESWCYEFAHAAISHGHAFAVVDSSMADAGETMADSEAAGVRPYVVLVKRSQYCGHRLDDSGKLVRLWYAESSTEPDGDWSQKTVVRIRVWTDTGWEVWNESGSQMLESGEHGLGFVPVVTLYAGRATGYMQSEIQLKELAHLCVKAWQSQSDQDNILHYVRVPILARSGNPVMRMGEDGTTTEAEMRIGGSVVDLGPSGALTWVEHSGAAVGAGQSALDKLRDEMRMAGGRFMQPDRAGSKTATQSGEEAAQDNCPLARIAGALGDALSQMVRMMTAYMPAGYIGSLPYGRLVSVNPNLQLGDVTQSQQALQYLHVQGLISGAGLYDAMHAAGTLPRSISYEVEQERIAEAGETGNNLGMVGRTNGAA